MFLALKALNFYLFWYWLAPYFSIDNNEVLFNERLSASCCTKPFAYIFFFPLIITAQHFLVRKLKLRKISGFAEGQLCP